MAQTGNNNQRVTNAELKKDLEYLIKGQDEMKEAVKLNTEHRIVCTDRWETHKAEHTSLRAKSWVGDIGAAVAGIAAAVTTALVKTPS